MVEIVDHLVSLTANSVATKTTALPDVITPNLDTDMILGKSEVLNSLGDKIYIQIIMHGCLQKER